MKVKAITLYAFTGRFIIMDFGKVYNALIYNMMRGEIFKALGIQLSAKKIFLENHSDFELKDYTFAFYNPIDASIHIDIDAPFFASCKTENELKSHLFFILFHEAYHHILMHANRKSNRNHQLFNIAADMEIHNMLKVMSETPDENSNAEIYFKSIKSACLDFLKNWDDKNYKPDEKSGEIKGMYCSDFQNNIAEEIYAKLLNSANMPENQQVSEVSAGGNSAKITESTIELPNGNKIKTVDIEWKENQQKNAEQRQIEENNNKTTQILAEKSIRQAIERQCGKGNGKINEFIKKLFKVKIDWGKILKSSLATMLAPSENFTWSRPRVSMMAMGYYLPSCDVEEKYGTILVCRDESGSMTEDDVAKSCDIIKQAKEHYAKIVVLKHDTEIVSENEYEELDDDAIHQICTRSACGGTSHKEVFEYVNNYERKHHEKISCVICITDCCSDIQDYQDSVPNEIPFVYLVPSNAIEWTKGIKGKIIEIE